eukprot:9492344-Heterocapsa_arctica.AAC.1
MQAQRAMFCANVHYGVAILAQAIGLSRHIISLRPFRCGGCMASRGLAGGADARPCHAVPAQRNRSARGV